NALNDARASGQVQVVWLKADPGLLATRLDAEPGDRPSLTGLSPAEEIANICADRAEAYQAIADHSLDVGNMSIEAIITKILAMK
ncbi:MAG: shikimate kinase, partial [Planctomycetota bacterium]|nr:shikimate kinase [Planctomycetota bacterium]